MVIHIDTCFFWKKFYSTLVRHIVWLCACCHIVVFLLHTVSTMETPLFPRESGQFIAERSRDVFVEDDGVQKVAEMLYALRHSDDLTASGWKKANPLAPPPTSDEGSLSSGHPHR